MKEIIHRLINHENLDQIESRDILIEISRGKYNNEQIASFLTIFITFKVHNKLVLKTLSTSFLEISTAASAQQSIIKSNLGNLLNFLEFEISNL